MERTTHTIEVLAIALEISEVNPKTLEWACDIVKFLTTGKIPLSKEEAQKIKNKVTRFIMINIKVYKRGFSTPF